MRSPTSTSGSAARSRCRSRPGARYPELALALASGERPEPRLGDFREGVLMTRFFWQVCLARGADGALEPLPDGLSDTVGRP